MVTIKVDASANFDNFLKDWERWTGEGWESAMERYINDFGLNARHDIARWGKRDLRVGNRTEPRFLTVGAANKGNTKNVRWDSINVKRLKGEGRLYINNKRIWTGRSSFGGQQRYSPAEVLIDSVPGQGETERIGSAFERKRLWIPKGGFTKRQVSLALRKSIRADPNLLRNRETRKTKVKGGGKVGRRGFIANVIYETSNGLILVKCRISKKADLVRAKKEYPHRVGGPGKIMAYMPRRASWASRRGRWGGRFRWQLYGRQLATEIGRGDRGARIIRDRIRHVFQRNYNTGRRRTT